MKEPIFLQPVCKDYLWGGNRLREEFGKESPADKIAETWELACHKDGSSVLLTGEYAGMDLQTYLQEHSEILGTACKSAHTMPVLIKLIDAKQDLSIQVHPEDAYAYAHENEPGKTEMWYILDALPGAALYYGVKTPLTREEFAARIQDETLTEVLNRVEVRAGELYFIPAGTLHAIGAGILLAEIQQNSNTTYRVYDYGRRDSDGNLRQLHVPQAQAVANLTPSVPTVQHPAVPISGGTRRLLADCAYFAADVVTVQSAVTDAVPAETFHHLMVLAGTGTLETASGSKPMKKGDSVLLPAGLGTYQVQGSCQYIVTKLGDCP